MADDHQLNAVLAHSLLGTVAAIRGAVDTVLEHQLDETTQASLLLMARRRLDFLTDQLRDLALGLPDEVLTFLDDLRRDEDTPAGAE
jgi:hypothetical protein